MNLGALARSAVRQCGAAGAVIFRVEGGRAHAVARHGRVDAAALGVPVERAIARRRIVHVRDPRARRAASLVAAPAVRDGVVVAVVALSRSGRRLTAPARAAIDAITTQAGAAVALARAESELARERERQRATAEILRTVSQVRTDPQPVLDQIVESALRLCQGVVANVFLADGDMIRMPAHNFVSGAPHASASQNHDLHAGSPSSLRRWREE